MTGCGKASSCSPSLPLSRANVPKRKSSLRCILAVKSLATGGTISTQCLPAPGVMCRIKTCGPRLLSGIGDPWHKVSNSAAGPANDIPPCHSLACAVCEHWSGPLLCPIRRLFWGRKESNGKGGRRPLRPEVKPLKTKVPSQYVWVYPIHCYDGTPRTYGHYHNSTKESL